MSDKDEKTNVGKTRSEAKEAKVTGVSSEAREIKGLTRNDTKNAKYLSERETNTKDKKNEVPEYTDSGSLIKAVFGKEMPEDNVGKDKSKNGRSIKSTE